MIEFTNDMEALFKNENIEMEVKAITKERQFCHHGPVKTRVYVWFNSDSKYKDLFKWSISDGDEIINRIYRARTKWLKKNVVGPLVNELKINAKISFSSKAGCQCGCSPGFILTTDEQPPFDLFVHVN